MAIVNIIGAGRVGRTFLRLLGSQVQDIASATRASAETAVKDAGHGRVADLAEMRPADIWLLTVPDAQIAGTAQALADTQAPAAIAIHCSGFHTADIMSPLLAKGWLLASVHPNLSFAAPDVSAARFSGTWCGVEGDEEALRVVEPLFKALDARTFRIGTETKALYHAAAVITNNFTTVLQAVALEAWAKAGVPDDVARDLNVTLLRSTVENIEKLGPAEALTGPAARGDREVVTEQGKQVAEWRPDVGQLYELLSRMAVNLKTNGVTSDDQDVPPRQ
ncbi:Rossmann-like and DUF2520 domain-containing protein [Silicimonas sp. MF1-12-2]|uniref:Rossmann-like and DUF2520 domain-containing protein n=1 Tax=Silicimonas sp. MF1-12-2 TaxID=3384793 RepID=UPI0039B4931B